MRLAIVINPNARRAQDPSLVPALEAICREAPKVSYQICVTHNLAELSAAIERIAKQGVDVLCPCGGDGTLTATLSAAQQVFGDKLPLWLPLAGGTMNTVAKNLGARTGPQAMLRSLLARTPTDELPPHRIQATLRIASRGEVPLDLQTLRAQADRPSVEAERVGFLASAAMGARFLAAYTASPTRGLWSASVLGLRTIGSSLIPGGGAFARWLFAPLRASLSVDGTAYPEPSYRLMIASTIPDVGLGMKVPWQAGSRPDRFHLVASSLPVTSNALQLHRMLLGKPLVGQPHLDTLAERVAMTFTQPEPIVLDGELFCAERLELSLGPTLRVISPVVAPQGIEPRTLRV